MCSASLQDEHTPLYEAAVRGNLAAVDKLVSAAQRPQPDPSIDQPDKVAESSDLYSSFFVFLFICRPEPGVRKAHSLHLPCKKLEI